MGFSRRQPASPIEDQRRHLAPVDQFRERTRCSVAHPTRRAKIILFIADLA
jgi:hypothetical protein